VIHPTLALGISSKRPFHRRFYDEVHAAFDGTATISTFAKRSFMMGEKLLAGKLHPVNNEATKKMAFQPLHEFFETFAFFNILFGNLIIYL